MKEARYSETLADGKVRCVLCPHRCLLTPGKHGICLTRQNIGGVLVTTNYCRPVSMAVDPIEKKPLYHFHPGSQIFSTGPNGCTLKCAFCQNHEISQSAFPAPTVTVKEIAGMVTASKTIGIAYTYSEPFIWFETIMDVGVKVRDAGLKNVMVTNGYMNPQPLAELLNVIDAMNIDIKSVRPSFYRRLCKGDLQPVLDTCVTVKKRCHLEITNLVIPGENDSDEDFTKLAVFIAENLGADTPLHLSRAFPRYRTAASQPTAPQTLMRAWEICKAKLQHVYVGNVESEGKSDTLCAACGTVLISRWGYSVKTGEAFMKPPEEGGSARCGKCGADTGIVC